MKTQKFLKVVRLMTFTALLGIVSLTASAITINDENIPAKTDGVENNMKETIALEDWMTDKQYFETREQKKLNVIEGWMIEQSYWKI